MSDDGFTQLEGPALVEAMRIAFIAAKTPWLLPPEHRPPMEPLPLFEGVARRIDVFRPSKRSKRLRHKGFWGARENRGGDRS